MSLRGPYQRNTGLCRESHRHFAMPDSGLRLLYDEPCTVGTKSLKRIRFTAHEFINFRSTIIPFSPLCTHIKMSGSDLAAYDAPALTTVRLTLVPLALTQS